MESVARAVAKAVDAYEAELVRAGARAATPAAAAGSAFPVLEAQQTLLAYFWSERTGWLFRLAADELTVHELPSLEQLRDDVVQAQTRLKSPRFPAANVLKRLGERLLPLLPERGQRLLVLADGPLQTVPLTILGLPGRDARDAHDAYVPVVAEFDVTYVATDVTAAGTERALSLASGVAVLAAPEFADPVAAVEQTDAPELPRSWLDRLTPLPASRAEAAAIAGLFADKGPVQVYTGSDATKARLRALAAEAPAILHVATHGFFAADHSDIAGLALAGDGTDPADQLLTVHDVPLLAAAPAMVVLNGCETSLGAELRGEGVRSLSQAFLRAGSDAVVGTLWRVSDSAAGALMELFYEEIAAGLAPGVALSRAQRRMLSGADGGTLAVRRNHPYFWGAYLAYQ